MFAAGWVGGQDGERASGRTTTGLFQFSDVIQEGVVLQMVSVVKYEKRELGLLRVLDKQSLRLGLFRASVGVGLACYLIFDI